MVRKTFLGIGAGPIQTGIFVAGAWHGGFDRIVLADVDPDLVAAIRASGSITVNTAGIGAETFDRVEIYNPAVPREAEILAGIAAEAVAVNTALPSTAFYRFVAPWLAAGFAHSRVPKYVYASENSTSAAQELRLAVGEFLEVYYLDTVIGKMSKVLDVTGSAFLPLAPGGLRGHLVEAFNTIYTRDAPGIEPPGICGLFPKSDLVPFEETKLYGHNAVHFMLGVLADRNGFVTMDQAAGDVELMTFARAALIDECGRALCRKFAGSDDCFESDNFSKWADGLLKRMTSPELADSVERVIRDPERKLGWNDRLIGAIRLCRSQGIVPDHLLKAVEALRPQVNWRLIAGEWERESELTRIKQYLQIG